MNLRSSCLRFAALVLLPVTAEAHFFVQPYSLPVPFSMYAWGASAALLASFIVVGVVAGVPRRVAATGLLTARPVAHEGRHSMFRGFGRAAALTLLLLCIVAGFVGSRNAFVNINMTLFWIVFVLGVPYAVALGGDFYAAVNPWRTLVAFCERVTGTRFDGRVRAPAWWGCTPALLLYMAFIWLELFGHLSPRGLSSALVVYTMINVAGAYAFGKDAWFRNGEFFGVMLRLIGQMAPWHGRWRRPFVGLLDEPAQHVSEVLFILFMLSSTAFDGLHSTLPWVQVFWRNIYPDIAPWLGSTPGQQYAASAQVYQVWQWASLLVSPLVYLAVFAAFIALAKVLTRSPASAKALMLRLAMSLVPIAFVYHVTHYYTLLLAQGGQVVRLVSDPFGFGWNLFGTAQRTIRPLMIDTQSIWHTQVALIVAGHIVSVYLAHLEALRLFDSPRRAAASQIPMLLLMMLFTTLGLWILSLPLAGS
jgi:hypothetical protein